MPWETGQIASCNDFLPPARDVAANVDRTTVKPAPPSIEYSEDLDSTDYHPPVKSQKSTTSYMRKSTVMKKTSLGSFSLVKSPE